MKKMLTILGVGLLLLQVNTTKLNSVAPRINYNAHEKKLVKPIKFEISQLHFVSLDMTERCGLSYAGIVSQDYYSAVSNVLL